MAHWDHGGSDVDDPQVRTSGHVELSLVIRTIFAPNARTGNFVRLRNEYTTFYRAMLFVYPHSKSGYDTDRR